MASRLPFMPLNVADFVADTEHMTNEQVGAYFRILMFMWARGAVLDVTDEQLARIAHVNPRRWLQIGPIVIKPLTHDERGWTQKRLTAEHARATLISAKRKNAGESTEASKALKDKKATSANAKHMPSTSRTYAEHNARGITLTLETETKTPDRKGTVAPLLPQTDLLGTPEQTPKPKRLQYPADAFEQFWSAYPRKTAKGDARKAFDRIKAKGKVALEEILAGIARYIANKADRIDYAHPATWLNAERWDDEWAQGQPNDRRSPSASNTEPQSGIERARARFNRLFDERDGRRTDEPGNPTAFDANGPTLDLQPNPNPARRSR